VSTQNQPAGDATQTLDPETAFSVVQNRVYGPVFFEKLASDYHIRPANADEANSLMIMAGQLREAHAAQEKQASTGLITSARAHLDAQLQQMGLGAAQPDTDQQTKTAAAHASFDPELANAILSLQAGVQE